MTQKSRKQLFIEAIDRALEQGPYRDDPHLHNIYCIGLLRELLAYSAIDLWEVRNHIDRLGDPDRPGTRR